MERKGCEPTLHHRVFCSRYRNGSSNVARAPVEKPGEGPTVKKGTCAENGD